MHFKLLLATILGLSFNQVSAGGWVGTYKSGDCGCNSVDEHTWSGTSACYTVDGTQIRSFGLSGPKSTPKTTCALFNNENCDGYGEIQSMGQGSGSFACTAVRENFGSFRCYNNA
ncbi:hypothetical protein AG0111_0g7025 [Alternaria gaisen]|uniref:Uncharacterized protein n=1 Tax=Alternaria gaisen TaxID=167740 RepID=A0ACB6FJU4_9PLEO|nr:hypothetical protein AG0111_0g7025 [Alternaria gaisen]